MRTLALLFVLAATACGTASDDADDADDAPPGGDTWIGTASSSYFDGANGSTITADVTWVSAGDGVYEPEGTVTLEMVQEGCTVTLDPSSGPMHPDTDGQLLIDGDSYTSVAGSYWDTTMTVTCPPYQPQVLPMTVAARWIYAMSPMPIDGDEIHGESSDGVWSFEWDFVKE